MQSVYSTALADWANGESYPSAEMQSVYSTALADWAKGESYPSAEMQSVYSTVLADWAKGESYPSAEMQSVYSTALADWALFCDDFQKKTLHIYWFIDSFICEDLRGRGGGTVKDGFLNHWTPTLGNHISHPVNTCKFCIMPALNNGKLCQ